MITHNEIIDTMAKLSLKERMHIWNSVAQNSNGKYHPIKEFTRDNFKTYYADSPEYVVKCLDELFDSLVEFDPNTKYMSRNDEGVVTYLTDAEASALLDVNIRTHFADEVMADNLFATNLYIFATIKYSNDMDCNKDNLNEYLKDNLEKINDISIGEDSICHCEKKDNTKCTCKNNDCGYVVTEVKETPFFAFQFIDDNGKVTREELTKEEVDKRMKDFENYMKTFHDIFNEINFFPFF